MVVLAKGELEQIALPAAQPPLAHVRAIDLSAAPGSGRAAAARALVSACEEQGFFKVTGHGVPPELVRAVEAAAAEFFALPQAKKEAAAGRPLGYGSKRIGAAGDLGWIEYLLLGVTPAGAVPAASFASWTLPCAADAVASLSEPSCPLRELLEEYAAAVRRMACGVLELMAEGLGVGPADALSRLVSDAESDNMLRVNHYPPRPELQGKLLTGFGEHTDPQIISVLRSNGTSGLEISAHDGAWTSVPPDADSFFINVGDALQVHASGADEREVQEREAQGGGEQREAEGVHDLLRRPADGREPGAAAAAARGRRPEPLQGVHLEGVQEQHPQGQARGRPPLPLRELASHRDRLSDRPSFRVTYILQTYHIQYI